MAAKLAAQAFPQLLDGQVTLDSAANGKADGSGFFRADYGDGIRFFGDADAGAMAGTELRREQWVHREGKKTGSGGNAIFLHDDRAIVQRSAWTEDRRQQIVGKASIQRNAAFDVGAQADLAFNDDQGSGLMLGEKIRRQHDVIVGIALGRGRAQERKASTKIGEDVTNLRLENHDQSEHDVGQNVADNPIQGSQLSDASQIKNN